MRLKTMAANETTTTTTANHALEFESGIFAQSADGQQPVSGLTVNSRGDNLIGVGDIKQQRGQPSSDNKSHSIPGGRSHQSVMPNGSGWSQQLQQQRQQPFPSQLSQFNNNLSNQSVAGSSHEQQRQIQVGFKSHPAPAVISESDKILTSNPVAGSAGGQELINLANLTKSNNSTNSTILCDRTTSDVVDYHEERKHNNIQRQKLLTDVNGSEIDHYDSEYQDENLNGKYLNDEDDYDDEDDDDDGDNHERVDGSKLNGNIRRGHKQSYSSNNQRSATFVGRLITRLKFIVTGLTNKLDSPTTSYTPYVEDTKDLLPGSTKYRIGKRGQKQSAGRTFRGSYRYSRIGIVMAVFKKLFSFLIQKSTLALIGAFLIHVTLGTVYTLSNINSYLTSYMRKHGTPNATYGGSMWISSSYAVGQGLSMALGGYIEKRFSARLSCILGCTLHSLSIMSTSRTIDHGRLAVLISYGFLPGFGCGLAYMTPMSNGFGWFPNRKGLVAGTILAGFGIGTFVFNMAQTAYVNPGNLSPPKDSGGYFTQDIILNNVPNMFIFIGSIYAAMQFVGCCLLFKPPSTYETDKTLDERPILVDPGMSLKKAIRTREFAVLFLVFGITNQGVLFVNSMLKEYGQIFIGNDMYLAWTGSMASIANSLGRLVWGMAIDRFSFTQCFTSITTIFATLMFLMPFEFILSNKLFYLLCTLGVFGSFSGWMSTYPVHISRVFGLKNSGMIYGLIFVSQVSN